MVRELVEQSYKIAHEHGWHDGIPTFGEKIALMHSELSEALEEFRDGHDVTEVYFNGDKPEGVPIELADCVIRIADFCGSKGIDLEYALNVKGNYNQTRPYRHGGKKV